MMHISKNNQKKIVLIAVLFMAMVLMQVLTALFGGPGRAWENGYQVTWIIRRLIGSMKFSFLGYLLISYFFARWDIMEIRVRIFVLVFLQVIHYVGLLAFACVYVSVFHILYSEYALFMAEALLLYILLPNVLASFVGMSIGPLKNTTAACACGLIVLFLFTTNLFIHLITYSFYVYGMENSPSMYYLWDIFRLSGGRTDIYDDYYYTASLGAVDYEKVLMWILLAVGIFLSVDKKFRTRRFVVTGLIIGAVGLLWFYLKPASKYVVYEECPFDSWNIDNIYEPFSGSGVDVGGSPEFSVDEYDINISLDRNMKAEVLLKPKETELQQYAFSLYRGFKVESITDCNKRKLDYVQNGDYIVVYPDEASDCSLMYFSYQGGSNYYISNKQCIYLTENIYFYPVPQCEVEKRRAQETGRTISHFEVDVNSALKVYCNLGQGEGNHFVGDAEGVMLYGGMLLRETNVDGNRIIYPLLRWSENQICEEYEKLCNLYEDAGYSIRNKDWFVTTFRKADNSELYNGLGYFSGSVEYLNCLVDSFAAMRRTEQ